MSSLTELWPTDCPTDVRRITLGQRQDGTWWTGIVHPGQDSQQTCTLTAEPWATEAEATTHYETTARTIWASGPGHPGPWHSVVSDLPIAVEPPAAGWSR